MADSTPPAPPAYEPGLLTDLQVALPLYVQTGPTQMDTVRIGIVNATTTPDGLRIGDKEIADALGKAAAVHLERAAESARRERARRQRHRELLQRLQRPTSGVAATDEACGAEDAEQPRNIQIKINEVHEKLEAAGLYATAARLSETAVLSDEEAATAAQRDEDALPIHARALASASIPALAGAALQAYVDRDMHRDRVLLSAVHEPQQRELMHAAYDLANHLYNATGQSGMEATD